MGTSLENRGEEGEEEEMIPWSCVDEIIRQELIQRLNPDQTLSGNNWRGLAGWLGYTMAEINGIESDKGINTRVFFNDYECKSKNSFNEVYRCLKKMERRDCIAILDKYRSRIQQNFEREKERTLLNNSMGPQHHHGQHSMVGASCGGCSCMPHSSVPQQHMCYPSCTSPHPSHNCFSHGGYPSSPCYHMPPSHPLQMQNGCVSGCSNNHPLSKSCSHMCSHQPASCLPPHVQMDINSTIPKCSPHFHQQAPGHHPNTNSMAFSDRPQVAGAGPNSYHQYYNVRTPSYSPRVSPENNNKPFNFSVSGSYVTGNAGSMEGSRPMSRGVVRGSAEAMNQSGQSRHITHSIQQQPNILDNKCDSTHQLPDNISPQLNSDVSNENNMSFPGSSMTQYYDANGLPSQQPYQTAESKGATASPIAHLTEMSKMPNQYQPTDEYKSVVAEQKIGNQRQRGRNTRGNGSIISSSSGNSTASSSSSSSGQSGGQPVRNQPSNMPEELRPMAELSIRKSPSVPNNIRPEQERKALSSKVFVTYSRDSEEHKLEVLRLSIFLKENEFSVYADVATDLSAMVDSARNVEPYQEYFSIADFILVCISPKYLEDISRSSPASSSPTTANGSRRPIHTYEIYQMMKEEHRQRSAAVAGRPRNKSRFVSLLIGEMSSDQIPDWLKKYYPVYSWPSEYENIGWFLKNPRERICAQPK